MSQLNKYYIKQWVTGNKLYNNQRVTELYD